jgi:hypothetical protein
MQGPELSQSRRAFMTGAALLALAQGASADEVVSAADEALLSSDAFLDELYSVNAEYVSAVVSHSISRATRLGIVRSLNTGALVGAWAPDAQHPDYRHLGSPFEAAPFALTHDALASAARHNFFFSDAELATQDKIIFGLRGCVHAEAVDMASGISVLLREGKPDHARWNCIIGVWEPRLRKVSTYKSSTVPNLIHMKAHALSPVNHGASMMATGLHRHRVGTHPNGAHGAPGAIIPSQQPGALRAAKAPPLLRLRDPNSPMSFSLSNQQLRWNVMEQDNFTLHIHAGNGDRPLDFSSAGCQVVAGYYRPSGEGEPYGPWLHFRHALGLSDAFVPNANGGRMAPPAEEGRAFSYMLLTGRDARIHAARPVGAAASPDLMRVRFGSRGPVVRAVQGAVRARLGAPAAAQAAAEFDRPLFAQVLDVQSASGYPDGIVTPRLARSLGIDLAGSFQ